MKKDVFLIAFAAGKRGEEGGSYGQERDLEVYVCSWLVRASFWFG